MLFRSLLDLENNASEKGVQEPEESHMETGISPMEPEEEISHVAEPSYRYGTEREEKR